MWVDISDKYEASDDGHIRNKKTKRVLHEFEGKDGYVRTQYDGKTHTVHRAIAEAFIPKIADKPFVNHKDGNKQNNHVTNLEWCTRSENMQHAYDNQLKRPPIGMSNGRCKLTNDDVEYIHKHYIPRSDVYGAKALSKRFNVAPQTICAVVNGQNWKDNFRNEEDE